MHRTVSCTTIFLGLLLWVTLNGQTGASLPHFDVASVKFLNSTPSSFNRPEFHTEAGRVDYHLIESKALVQMAYPLPFYEIVWPTGDQSAFYDVSATMPPNTTAAQRQLMLQDLLAARFRFKAHRETRRTNVYALEVAPGGPKFHKAVNPPDESYNVVTSGGRKGGGWFLSGKRMNAKDSDPSGLRISVLVDRINGNFGPDRIVIDETGLEGFYDIELQTEPDIDVETTSGRGARPSPRPSLPTLFSAFEKQLGLRIEKKTVPIEMFVIDHMERIPTEN